MKIEIHIHHHDDNRILDALGDIMAAIDTLTTEVEETKTVQQSAIVLLQGLKTRLDEAIASGDPIKLQQLSDDLNTSTDSLAAAVAANTPAA